MKHFIQKIPKKIGVILAMAVLVIVSLYIVKPVIAQQILSNPLVPNVHGGIWSDMPNQSDQEMTCTNINCGRGLGAISVNNLDNPILGTIPYGVTLNLQTGKLTGAAWGEYSGWLKFDPSGPFPTGLGTTANPAQISPQCLLDTATTECPVTGWIRFTAGSTPESGGWDGWVSMKGKTTSLGGSYGVVYNKASNFFKASTPLQSNAWGDAVVGWINFDKMKVETIIDPTLLTCIDVNGVEYTYPVGGTIPAECEKLTCKDTNGVVYTYGAGQPVPSQCQTPDICWDIQAVNQGQPLPCNYDYCPDLPGIQTFHEIGRHGTLYNNEWYGLAAGVCMKSVCSNYSGFYATPPIGEVAFADGTCGKAGTIDPGTGGTKPIKPIYIEN